MAVVANRALFDRILAQNVEPLLCQLQVAVALDISIGADVSHLLVDAALHRSLIVLLHDQFRLDLLLLFHKFVLSRHRQPFPCERLQVVCQRAIGGRAPLALPASAGAEPRTALRSVYVDVRL